MEVNRIALWLLSGMFLLGGCALPGYEHTGPRPPVEERGQPADSGSRYERYEEAESPAGEAPDNAEQRAPEALRTREVGKRELPLAVSALLAQARTQREEGRLADAAATLERALRIAPREPTIYRALAEVRLQEGRLAQAEQFAHKGISLAGGAQEEQAQLWAIVARCRWAANDSEGAKAAEAKARELQKSGWQWW